MVNPNSIDTICAQFAEQISATMAAIIKELFPTINTHAKPQLEHQRKVLICGYTEEEDCLCESTNSFNSVYRHINDEDNVDLDFKEEESPQKQLQIRQDDVQVIHEVGDREEATIEDPSSAVNQVCAELIHSKVISVPASNFLSTFMADNVVEEKFGANQKGLTIAVKRFDKSPEQNGYIVELKPKPPDEYKSLGDRTVHGFRSSAEPKTKEVVYSFSTSSGANNTKLLQIVYEDDEGRTSIVEMGTHRFSAAAAVAEQPITPLVQINSASGITYPTLDPRIGEVIVDVPEGNAKDINCAVSVARKAFDEEPRPKMTPYGRLRILLRFANLVEKYNNESASIETWDNREPYEQAAKFEITMLVRLFHSYDGWPDKILGFTDPAGGPLQVQVLHEPISVAVQIIPWNFLWCFHEACFPLAVLNVVSGYDPIIGAARAHHMDVDKLAFTGSTNTGIYQKHYKDAEHYKDDIFNLVLFSLMKVFWPRENGFMLVFVQSVSKGSQGECKNNSGYTEVTCFSLEWVFDIMENSFEGDVCYIIEQLKFVGSCPLPVPWNSILLDSTGVCCVGVFWNLYDDGMECGLVLIHFIEIVTHCLGWGGLVIWHGILTTHTFVLEAATEKPNCLHGFLSIYIKLLAANIPWIFVTFHASHGDNFGKQYDGDNFDRYITKCLNYEVDQEEIVRGGVEKGYYKGLSKLIANNFNRMGPLSSMPQCINFFFLGTEHILVGGVGVWEILFVFENDVYIALYTAFLECLEVWFDNDHHPKKDQNWLQHFDEIFYSFSKVIALNVQRSHHSNEIMFGLFSSIAGGINYYFICAGARAFYLPIFTVFSFGIIFSIAAVICKIAFQGIGTLELYFCLLPVGLGILAFFAGIVLQCISHQNKASKVANIQYLEVEFLILMGLPKTEVVQLLIFSSLKMPCASVANLLPEEVKSELNYVRSFSTIACTLGKERKQWELIPFVSMNNDAKVLLTMMEELRVFIHDIEGLEHAHVLSSPLMADIPTVRTPTAINLVVLKWGRQIIRQDSINGALLVACALKMGNETSCTGQQFVILEVNHTTNGAGYRVNGVPYFFSRISYYVMTHDPCEFREDELFYQLLEYLSIFQVMLNILMFLPTNGKKTPDAYEVEFIEQFHLEDKVNFEGRSIVTDQDDILVKMGIE